MAFFSSKSYTMKKLIFSFLLAGLTLSTYSCRETTEEKTEDAIKAIGEDIEDNTERAAKEIKEEAEELEREIKEEVDEEIHETDDQIDQ